MWPFANMRKRSAAPSIGMHVGVVGVVRPVRIIIERVQAVDDDADLTLTESRDFNRRLLLEPHVPTRARPLTAPTS